MIGIQLVECVRTLHSLGYVHADIKMDNILIGENNQVYLIDYGCAERYLLPNGNHRPDDVTKGIANIHFGSKNVLNRHTVSMRDDLIQVIYSLICIENVF